MVNAVRRSVNAGWIAALVLGSACSRLNPSFGSERDANSTSTTSTGTSTTSTDGDTGFTQVASDGADSETTASNDETDDTASSSGGEEEYVTAAACCMAQSQAGCSAGTQGELIACVCAIQSSCCDEGWSESCAHTAMLQCNLRCPPPSGCCMGAGPSCQVPTGVDLCEDYGCCDDLWTESCVDQAVNDEVFTCDDDYDSCCVEHAWSGCDRTDTTTSVCMIDNACCEGPWDGHCVELAASTGACSDDDASSRRH